MPAFIKNLTVDCADALAVARFWAAALGSDVDEDSTPERAYVEAAAWGGPNIWFRGGRGPKAAANRVHLDLRALTSMDEEVERLVGLGATVVERFDDITVMVDPEGNEFCVEPGPGDPTRRLDGDGARGVGGGRQGVSHGGGRRPRRGGP
jgi:Glyoxalase-like domain